MEIMEKEIMRQTKPFKCMHVCVCACVCAYDTERERVRVREGEGGKEGEIVRVF